MSDQSFALSALNAIVEKARADRDRYQKELEKVQTKLETAKEKLVAADNRVKTLEDTMSQLSGGIQGKSHKDAVFEILDQHDGDGLTAKEILEKLEAANFTITSQNPGASIHMAADQLIKEGKIEALSGDGGKRYRKKTSDDFKST